jgi:type IV pilus assembly protein PilV
MLRTTMSPPTRRHQRGFTLIEVLIALLVFSLGVLSLVAVQASAVRLASDARHRATAAFLADQLLARMLISDRATVTSFSHQPTGTVSCAPSGTATTNPLALEWLQEVSANLPNAEAANQQVVVAVAGTEVTVTVRLCWQQGSETPRTLSVVNQVQFQP